MWGEQERQIKELQYKVLNLETLVTKLVVAHDELFDLLAEDLGYETGVEWSQWGVGFVKQSPRRAAKTNPVPEVIRKKTKRCK